MSARLFFFMCLTVLLTGVGSDALAAGSGKNAATRNAECFIAEDLQLSCSSDNINDWISGQFPEEIRDVKGVCEALEEVRLTCSYSALLTIHKLLVDNGKNPFPATQSNDPSSLRPHLFTVTEIIWYAKALNENYALFSRAGVLTPESVKSWKNPPR